MDGKWLVVALIIGFVVGLWYGKAEELPTQSLSTAPPSVTGAATGLPDDFKTKVEAFVTIPDDALIAKIDDITKARAQQPQLYTNAKNGDYVIAFGDTVIIYDYQANKLVDKFKVIK